MRKYNTEGLDVKLEFKVMLYIVMALMTTQIGCSADSLSRSLFQENPSEVNVWIPWTKSKGKYSLEKVKIGGIQDLRSLKSRNSRFINSPGVSSKGKIVGASPTVQFIVDQNDEYFPTDQFSTELFTIYAHLQNLRKQEESLAQLRVNQHLDIGVSVKYLDSGRPLKNNAMFVGGLQAMLFVPYTEKHLPISLNAGIVAHEYFHSIFYRFVNEPISGISSMDKYSIHSSEEFIKKEFPQIWFSDLGDLNKISEDRKIRNLSPLSKIEEDILYEQTILRGLNEGLADFWGWMYSQDSEFISNSLPSEKESRRIDVKARVLNPLIDFEKVVSAVQDSKSLIETSYKLGTQYARQLYAVAEILNPQQSKLGAQILAQSILKNLSLLRDDVFTKRNTSERISPSASFLKLVITNREISSAECEYWKEHLNLSETKELLSVQGSCQ